MHHTSETLFAYVEKGRVTRGSGLLTLLYARKHIDTGFALFVDDDNILINLIIDNNLKLVETRLTRLHWKS